MRAIHSNSITGPEAICVAAFAWWWGSHGDGVLRLTEDWLKEAGPTALMDRTDYKVGETVLQGVPGIAEGMMRELFNAPGVSEMLAHAALEWPSPSKKAALAEVKDFLRTQLRAEVGQMVLKTGWFDRNKRAIEAEKRRLRTVRSVLES